MKELVVDLCMLDTKEKIHEYFSEKLRFPKWYGRNLDALYDELTSICEPICITCYGVDEMLPVCTKGLINVLRDAACSNQFLILNLK